MPLEDLLHSARQELKPETGSKERVFAMMKSRMRAEQALHVLRDELAPSVELKQTVWARVASSMRSPVLDLLTRLSQWLSPSSVQRATVSDSVMARLKMPTLSMLQRPALRLAVSFAVFLVLVRISPLIFLAPQSSAQSSVLLLPTRGTVELFLQELWQGVDEQVTLKSGVQLRTGAGEATVVLHDDGNIRLGENTHVILRDVSDRPEDATTTGPSLTLLAGRIWVQGLVPKQVRGIVIATPQGDITVQEGSVSISIERNGNVVVSAWDRHVVVEHEGQTSTLVSGEYAHLTDTPAFLVQESSKEAARVDWVSQNLDRDAVHRREVAQLQRERRAADAGILPTSPLYTVKRIAERVDLIMTFGEEDKVRKQLAFASTRLDEAAALLQEEPQTDVSVSLQEYHSALLQIATGSGADPFTKELIAAEMNSSIAEVAAVSPADSTYILKRAVLEASAALPDSDVMKADVEGIILVDTLDALQQSAIDGDLSEVQKTFADLEPYLKSVKEGKSELTGPTRKEALALLEQFATTVAERDALSGDVADALLSDTSEYLPVEPIEPTVIPLTDEQIDVIVAQMVDRIFRYNLPRSRWNQLHAEFRAIELSSDRGRILRALYASLPEDLAGYVRTEIQNVREETKAAQ